MTTYRKYQSLIAETSSSYDDDFFDDILGMFPDASGHAPKAGRCGKYIYDSVNWGEFIGHSENYYPPKGDFELIQQGIKEIQEWGIPQGTPYIDWGVGGASSFRRYALPVIRALNASEYIGVDFSRNALKEISNLEKEFDDHPVIKTEQMDMFFLSNKVVAKNGPALGVMNGLTLGNMDGSLEDTNVDKNLAALLKHLSQMCSHGWLLVTIDTNQDAATLKRAYVNPDNSRLCLSILGRAAKELPMEGFKPSLFSYDVEFFPKSHLLAHMAVATETQDFKIGPYPVHIEKDQKIHLFNSYKFPRNFFEHCVHTAGLIPLKSWQHETGMMLYLLRDNLCPVPAPLAYRREGSSYLPPKLEGLAS